MICLSRVVAWGKGVHLSATGEGLGGQVINMMELKIYGAENCDRMIANYGATLPSIPHQN
jgi:hypothetical protein